MGKRKRESSGEREAVEIQKIGETDNTANDEDGIRSHKKKKRKHDKIDKTVASEESNEMEIESPKRKNKKKHEKQKKDKVNGGILEVEVTSDDVKSAKKKKSKHRDRALESSKEIEDQSLEHQENCKEKRKKHKHTKDLKGETLNSEKLDASPENAKISKKKQQKHREKLSTKTQDQESAFEVEDHLEEHEESHKRKRKKRKHREAEKDEAVGETLEANADDVSSAKKRKRKHRDKTDNKESTVETEEDSERLQKTRKKHKHKTKPEEDEVLGSALEEITITEDVKSAKKKRRKHEEKTEETAASKGTDEEITNEKTENPKVKKRRKHRKEENNDLHFEEEHSTSEEQGTSMKQEVSPPNEDATPKSEEADRVVSRDSVSEETREKLKQEWQDKTSLKRLRMQQPKMFLIDNFTNDEDQKTTFKPVEMQDLQDLLQCSVLGSAATINKVRFCKILRPTLVSKVVVMVVNGISDRIFQENKDCFPHLTANYDVTGQIHHSHLQQKVPILDQLLYIAVSKTQLRKRAYDNRNQGKYDTRMENTQRVTPQPVKLVARTTITDQPGRTHYMLKEEEKSMWRYPRADDPAYTHTKHSDTVSDNSPIISVDCEMCVTKNGSELTRVSLVDEKYNVLYNSLVKPRNPIIDYVTRYSGITKELLDPVTARIEDVQRDIIALLPRDTILVGQSLENDLRALKLYHPHVIDTSSLFTGSYRVALRKLAWRYLGLTIQAHEGGHDSVEDAKVTLKLLQLKIERGSDLEKYEHNKQSETTPTESIFRGAQTLGKISMLVDSMTVARQFMKDPVGALACQSDSEALKKAVQAIPHSHFVCVQFYNFFKLTQGISQEEAVVKETLRQLDKRMKKLWKKLPFNSLFLVVMAEDSSTANKSSISALEEMAHGRFFTGLKVKY